MNIVKPATQKEMVDQLWFAIIGSNGDGLATKIKDTADRVVKIEKIMPQLLTKAEHDDSEKDREKKAQGQANRRRMRWHDKMSLIFTFLATVFFGFQAYGAVFGPVPDQKHKIEMVPDGRGR